MSEIDHKDEKARLTANIMKVHQDLLDSSPERLRDLKIKRKHLDILARTEVTVSRNPQVNTLAMRDGNSQSKLLNYPLYFHYNDENIGHLTDDEQQKKINHEYGHFFQKLRGHLPSKIMGTWVGSLLGQRDGPVTKALQIVSGAAVGWGLQALAYKCGVSFNPIGAAAIGSVVATPALNYLNHLSEYDADKFADKAMPEISGSSGWKKDTERLGDGAKHYADNKWDLFVNRVKSLGDVHPLRQLREDRSDKRCAQEMTYRYQQKLTV